MSPRHRAVIRSRRYGGGQWWVEWARAGAALFALGAWAVLAWALTG